MKTKVIETEEKIDELLSVLDRDVEHLETSLSQLDRMRELVVRRDDAGLGALLEMVRGQAENFAQNESRRQLLRAELAQILNEPAEQITLTRLECMLAGHKRTQLAEKKQRLRSLTARVKKEHFSTRLLLADCARFNRMLLKKIFDICSESTVTYSSGGSVNKEDAATFVNVKF